MDKLYIEGAEHHVSYDHTNDDVKFATEHLNNLPHEEVKKLFSNASNGQPVHFTHGNHSFTLIKGGDGYEVQLHH